MKKEDCRHCHGTGSYIGYPYYSTVMPKETKIKCGYCNGRGKVWVRTDNLALVTTN